MPWKKGQSGNPKGQPKGADLPGRPKDEFIQKCRQIIERGKILEFLERVATGQEPESETRDRLRAAEMLLDRGYGKADQNIDLTTQGHRIAPAASTADLQFVAQSLTGGTAPKTQ